MSKDKGSVRWRCGRCMMEVTTDYMESTFKLCPNCGGGMFQVKVVKPKC